MKKRKYIFNVGDKVIVQGYSEQDNGRTAIVQRIDGEYHYVTLLGIPKEGIMLEVYRTEIRHYNEDEVEDENE